ncbi:MAG TPA: glycosyltransferase 87 family protein, partial [Isosphaeraceae bacterium]|nr:glycosyltransferase 87 family protein [Isosphaeraceae bacterium]
MSVFPLSRPQTLWSRRRAPLGLVVFLAVGVQAAIAVLLAGNPRFYGTTTQAKVLDDVHLYQDYADRMLSGEVPYRDFRVEYPPLALPFFVAPAWLAGGSFSHFWLLFGAEMLLLNAASLAMVAWWVRQTEGSRAALLRMLWATLLFVPLAQLSVSRFDLAPAFILFSAAVLWALGKSGCSGVLSGLGVLVKIVPGVVLGPMLADEVCRWKESRLRGSWAGLVALGLGLACWIAAVGGPGEMRESLRYHLDRGLEAGSLGAGGLMALGRILQWPMRTEYLFKSTQLVAPGEPWISSLAFPTQAVALLTVMLAFVRRGRGEPLRYMGASVLA